MGYFYLWVTALKCSGSCNILVTSESVSVTVQSQLTVYLSAERTSEEEPLLELGPEDILLLFIMMQNSL